jgi:hypothetical protein
MPPLCGPVRPSASLQEPGRTRGSGPDLGHPGEPGGVAGRMMLAGHTGGQTRREASGAEPVPAFPSHRAKNAGKRG